MRLVNGHYVPKGKCANLGDNTDDWKVSEGMMMEILDYEKGMKGHFDKTILLCLKIHFFIYQISFTSATNVLTLGDPLNSGQTFQG